MRTRRTATFILLAISASLIGCTGRTRFPSYYTLQVPPAPDPPVAGGGPVSIAVHEFRAPAYLRQGAIVYRPSAEQIGFYNYHRWAVDPREFLTHAIVDRLRASGRFAEVKIYDGRPDVDFILSGCLEKLEEVDYQGGVKVEVALSAQMTDLHSGKTVWAHTASETAAVDKRTVPAIVAEMSHAMDRTLQKLLASLSVSTTASLEPRQDSP
jgi:cholesterol transport system auxiliary component